MRAASPLTWETLRSGAGGEGFALHRVDAEGEADDGAVVGLVELQPAYDAGGAADRFYLLPLGGDDYVPLRGTHRLAALRGDHARLHAPVRRRPRRGSAGRARGDPGPLPLSSRQAANLSKKRAK